MGHTHIVRSYTRSTVETVRSSDQIGSTERVRSIGSTTTGANPRATTEYPVAAILPPSLPPRFILPLPLFRPPREPHSRYIFTEMQIALVHRAPRFCIISSRLVRIKVLPWKEEDFGIYRGSEGGLDWLYPLKYELLLYRGILPTLWKRLSRTSTRIIFREERQLLWTFHFTVYCSKFLTFLCSRKYIINTNKCVHVCRNDSQEYEKYGKQGFV